MNRLLQIILGIERPKGAEPAGAIAARADGAAAGNDRRGDPGGRDRLSVPGVVALPARAAGPVAAQAGADGGPARAHAAGAGGHAGRAGLGQQPARDDQVAPGDHSRRFREHEVLRSVYRPVQGGRDRLEDEARVRGRAVVGRAAARDAAARPGQERAASANLEALGRGRELFLYDLESAARPGSGESARKRTLEDIQPNRPISPLGDAIHGVLAGHRGQPVAGLVIASDGRSNTGEEPLRAIEAAVRQNIPIYAIAAGAAEGPRNVRLAEVEVSPVVFVRDPTTLAVVVEARGLRDAEATIVLEQRINEGEWEAVANQRVVLGEDGILKRTTFRITPKVVGQYEFRAKVEDAGPELTQEDNVATAAVKVVRQQIRVLLIAGSPSPEVQFLRNALMRDQRVEFAALAAARRSRVSPAGRSADQPAAQRLGRAAQLRRASAGRP